MCDDEDQRTSENQGQRPQLKDLRQQELIESEKAYLSFIIRLTNAIDKEDVIRECFGNLEEIIELSQELIAALEAWEKAKSVPLSTCFLPLKEKFLRVYETYCVKYQFNMTRLKEHEKTDKKFELDEKLALMRAEGPLDSLQSVLIMPVQRIMRYPLILKGILETTEDKEEKEDLENVYQVLRNIADEINEKKRVQEIHQLRRQVQHSQTVRISSMIFDITNFDQEDNQVPETTAAFQELLDNFLRLHEFTKMLKTRILKLSRDLAAIITYERALAESIHDYYDNSPNDSKLFLDISRKGGAEALAIKDNSVEKTIHSTDELLSIFETINELIKARSRLIMECKHARLSTNISSDQTRKFSSAIRSYHTIHPQLLKELPIFLNHAEGIVSRLSRMVLDMRKKFLMTQAKYIYKLGHAAQKLPDGEDTTSRYEIAVQQAITKLESFSFVKENNEHTSNLPELLRKSPRMNSHKLVTAVSGYRANKSGEITVEKGDVLRLLSKHGTTSQVALGEKKGYIPSCILRPYNSAVDKILDRDHLSGDSEVTEARANRTLTLNRKEIEARSRRTAFPLERPRSAIFSRKFVTISDDNRSWASSSHGQLTLTPSLFAPYPENLPPPYESLFPSQPSTSTVVQKLLPQQSQLTNIDGYSSPGSSSNDCETIIGQKCNEKVMGSNEQSAPQLLPNATQAPSTNPNKTTNTDLALKPTPLFRKDLLATEGLLPSELKEEMPSMSRYMASQPEHQIAATSDGNEKNEMEPMIPIVLRQREPTPIPAPRRSRMYSSVAQQILSIPEGALNSKDDDNEQIHV